jgi:choline dehydrogenase
MGYDDNAVTDSAFRVHGIEGLRVVDAAAMPKVVSANLNAPVQMMAARAADFILGRPQLDPVNLEYSI